MLTSVYIAQILDYYQLCLSNLVVYISDIRGICLCFCYHLTYWLLPLYLVFFNFIYWGWQRYLACLWPWEMGGRGSWLLVLFLFFFILWPFFLFFFSPFFSYILLLIYFFVFFVLSFFISVFLFLGEWGSRGGGGERGEGGGDKGGGGKGKVLFLFLFFLCLFFSFFVFFLFFSFLFFFFYLFYFVTLYSFIYLFLFTFHWIKKTSINTIFNICAWCFFNLYPFLSEHAPFSLV